MRTFTVSEAVGLLPILDALLKRAQTAANTAAAVEMQLQGLANAIHLSGGMRVDLLDLSIRKQEHRKAVQQAGDTLAEISAIGVEVRDLLTGRVEFPFQLDDQVVMLCWTQGETAITHWRPADAEPEDRRALDARFQRGERPQ